MYVLLLLRCGWCLIAKRKKMSDESASKLRVAVDLSYEDLMGEKVCICSTMCVHVRTYVRTYVLYVHTETCFRGATSMFDINRG